MPPAQIKAFAASRGTRAKTDRIDAELIARFLPFRPVAGRELPMKACAFSGMLTSKRGQLVEAPKRLLAQTKAHEKLGTADMIAGMDKDLRTLLDRQISELEGRIEQTIAANENLRVTADILRSVPGIGPVTS